MQNIINMEPMSPLERGDIVRPIRLQGFSDAVFATAATLLVIPIRKFTLNKEESLKDALLRRYPEMIVFVVGYIIICTIWESHNLRFKVIAKIDDFIVCLTLVSLMCTTFLPFTVALEGNYGKYRIAVRLPCTILLVIEILELIMFFYAFHTPRLLSSNLRDLERNELRIKKFQIFAKVFFNCALFITVFLFSFWNAILAGVLLTTVIFSPVFKRVISYCSRKICCPDIERQSNIDVLTGKIDKERIEVFSDAAIAIVATLLVLDITTEEFPVPSHVKEKGLDEILKEMRQPFVAYMGSYITIAILWFVHHSVLHQIKSLTAVMTLCNKIFLAFLAGSPFVSTLVNKFTGKSSHNEKIAVRVSCVIVFMAGIMQVVVFILAFVQRNKLMYNWAIPEIGKSNRTHIYVLLKTLIIPLMTFVTFCSSLSTDYVTFVVYHVSLGVVPLLFVLLKIACACHCNQHPAVDETSSTHNSQEDNTSTQERLTELLIVQDADPKRHEDAGQ